ncbi:MAG TPA: VWA domain-containing protein [Bryobacteraceae bacterium]|nr:VWA domain-containing protein [Bryobacteraceae bacterium]
MFFLNLTAAEFLSLLGVLGGIVTALYLLDRAKRRRVVSTLRFWSAAGVAEQRQSRRKMNDPWSLLLQLLSLALLLLALSRVQWGNSARRGRDHVLLLDISSWTAAHMAGNNSPVTVLDREKQLLQQYFALLPRNDRAMLVAVDGLATPLTGFISDQRQFGNALSSAVPSFSALNVDNALSFARQASAWSDAVSGEIVYSGPQLTVGKASAPPLNNVRLLPVPADRENVGIRQLTVRQLLDEPDSWQAFVVIKNYGHAPAAIQLAMRYGSTTFAPRRLTISAQAESTAEYAFSTKDASDLTASLKPGGSLAADDQATLSVPHVHDLSVIVFTDRPQILKPLLESNRALHAVFYPIAQFKPDMHADVIVLDRFTPGALPGAPTLWLDPPTDHSPLPVADTVSDALVNWATDSGVQSSSLHAKPLHVPTAHTFQTFAGDHAIATIGENPVVVARSGGSGHPASAVVGFDPAAGELRFEVTAPLLFADLLQWLSPDAFRTLTLSAETVGLAEVALDPAEENLPIHVTDSQGLLVPAVRRNHRLQVFVNHPTSLRISSAESTRLLSLRLPAIADQLWQPPANASQGLPVGAWFIPPAVDLWKWLAVAAGFCLIGDWFFFARIRRGRGRPQPPATAGVKRAAERDLVAK